MAAVQQLGYADGRALLGRLEREGLLEVGLGLGLILERPADWDPGPRFREFFADRLIVPELRQARPIWFIGRAAENVPTRRPKYLYRDKMDHLESSQKGLAELIVLSRRERFRNHTTIVLKKRQPGDDVGAIRRLVWVGGRYRDYAERGSLRAMPRIHQAQADPGLGMWGGASLRVPAE